MLRAFKKLMIGNIIALLVINSAQASEQLYLKIKDDINTAKIYYKSKSGAFIHKSFLKNKGGRLFKVEREDNSASVCKDGKIVKVAGINGWVCKNIFEEMSGVPDGYFVYGSSVNKKENKIEKKNEETKNSLIDEPRYKALRELISLSKTQKVMPDSLQLVVLSKNYTNRIRCEGKIKKIIYNQSHNIEVEYDEHNIFVKAPNNKNAQFLSDLVVKCGGSVFQLNTAYDSSLPSQQVVLHLPADKKVDLEEYKQEIKKFSALNFEVKVSEILKMAYNENYPGYWLAEDMLISYKNIHLLKKIKTSIDNLLIYVFVSHDTENNVLPTIKEFSLKNNLIYVATGFINGVNGVKGYLVAQEVKSEK